MTRVTGFYWPQWDAYELRLTGHATGSERTCAAVSGIVYALAGMLENAEGTKILEESLEPGDVCLRFSGDDRVLGALQAACIGLLQLEKAEPERVKCKISEKIFEKI